MARREVPKTRRTSGKQRPRRSGKPRQGLETDQRRLLRRLREILGPEDERAAERLAVILVATVEELNKQQTSLRRDPNSRKELEAAHQKLSAFYDFWKKHPKLEELIPRSNHEQNRPVSKLVAEMLRKIDAAISRLPIAKGREGTEEIIRRWLSFAVVSALKSPEIAVTRDASGKAVMILGAACKMMKLPRVSHEALCGYIRTGSNWAAKL